MLGRDYTADHNIRSYAKRLGLHPWKRRGLWYITDDTNGLTNQEMRDWLLAFDEAQAKRLLDSPLSAD